MSTLLLATITGVIALVFWGTSDWLVAKSSKEFTSREINVTMQVAGMLLMAVVWGVAPRSFHSMHDVWIILFASAFFTAAYLCFVKGLASGETSVVVPIGNAYPLITLLLTFIFISVSFSRLQILALVTIILGSVLLGVETMNWRRLHKSFSHGAVYGFMAAILWGTGFFFENYVIKDLSWQSIEFLTSEAMGVYALSIALLTNKKNVVYTLKNAAKNKKATVSGLLLTTGSIGFYIGATRAKSILIPAVIASGAPLFTSILAKVFDHEKLILLKRVGVVLVVLGILLLNFN